MKRFNELITAAIQALENAYVPQSDSMRFASAVLTRKGNIYSSGQYYSDTYSLEQAALAHASAHGEHEIVAIASVASASYQGTKYCRTCGMCKQLLYEKYLRHKRDIDVIMANINGEYVVKKISEIVPYPWP